MEDPPGIAGVHVRSWRAAYRGVVPDELLDGLSVSERERSWRAALGDGEDARITLVALYVDPDRWRQGVGGALLASALERVARRGCREAVLWVLPENRAALAFYERFGFEVEAGVEKIEERSGRPVIRLRASLPPASSR